MTYTVFQRPLPPGLVTLREYAQLIGRSAAYLKGRWRPLEGFPEPEGELKPRGRHGGGRGELVYRRDALDTFRREHDNLWGWRSTRLIISHDPGERVTLEEFAAICAACGVTPDPGGFPGCPGADGLRHLGVLIDWHNTLPAAAGPRLTVTPLGPEELVTLAEFARLAGVEPTTVVQYRDDNHEFPPAASTDGTLYWLSPLARWWNSRPGKAPRAATAARAERALQILGDDAPAALAIAGRLRAAHPGASVEELGQLADPPLTRDTISRRIRALLVLADQRASNGAHEPAPGPGGRHDASFDAANRRRLARAGAAAGARAERALQILGDDAPAALAIAGRLRAAHPGASVEELGQLADPPLTRDAIGKRISRLLAMADRRASDLGLPGTRA